MSDDEINLLDQLGVEKTLSHAKDFLTKFEGLDIKNIVQNDDDGSILVYYVPKVENRIAIYADIVHIMSFFWKFIGEDLKTKGFRAIGIEALLPGNFSRDNIFVVSEINLLEKIGEGDIVYWYNNSIRNEPLLGQKQVYLLVEGETEYVAYPILFKSRGYSMKGHGIKLLQYSQKNLKNTLAVLNALEQYYYLVCDNDKSDIITDLRREGFFKSDNYHILEKGEFEDYVQPGVLVRILQKMNPGICITEEYIEANRTRGKSTSKIIETYYYESGNRNGHVFPGKPKLGEEIAYFWSQNQIPSEINNIIDCIMNIS